MAERIKLGGLWLNRTRDGREYLSGKLSPTVKLLIFPNDFKSGENQPSHVMYLAPIEQDETQRQNQSAPDSFFGGSGRGSDRGEGSDGGNGAEGDLGFEGQSDADDDSPEDNVPTTTPGRLASRPSAPHAATAANAPPQPAARPYPASRDVSAAPSPRSAPQGVHGAAVQRASQPVNADRRHEPAPGNRGAAPVPAPRRVPERSHPGNAGNSGNSGNPEDDGDMGDPFSE